MSMLTTKIATNTTTTAARREEPKNLRRDDGEEMRERKKSEMEERNDADSPLLLLLLFGANLEWLLGMLVLEALLLPNNTRRNGEDEGDPACGDGLYACWFCSAKIIIEL